MSGSTTVGTSVTFTATVSPSTATGTVDFSYGGSAITGCSSVAVASGTATCTTSSLPAGSDTVTAAYSGDANDSGSSGNDTVTVASAPAFSIVNSSLPSTTVGASYGVGLRASGGSAPFTWSVTSGALPGGLTLSPAGLIVGTVETYGKATFTVTATDAAGSRVSQVLSIQVGSSTLAVAPPVVSVAATPDGGGYWLAGAAGGVAPRGDAGYYGSMAGKHLDAPVVSMASTPDGKGYWLVAADGGVFTFGDAVFRGSAGGKHLDAPVVGIAADAVTGGYWLVAADGGIFAFDAPFRGSGGGKHLNMPVIGMSVTQGDTGYRLVAADGGIFSFGAAFYGSLGATHLNAPASSMAADPVSGGYWVVARDGGVFSFHAPFYGVGR